MRGADAPEPTRPLCIAAPSHQPARRPHRRVARERGARRRRWARSSSPSPWSPCCSSGRRREHLQAALPERRPARQGRRRAGRRPAHRLGARRSTLTDDNQAEITIAVQDGYAPLHEGTTAIIRATSLSGIANRYIALTPGPNSNPKLPDGATLGTDSDDVDRRPRPALQHARPETRAGAAAASSRASRTLVRQGGTQANAATKYFNPALSAAAPAGQRARPPTRQTLNAFLRNAARTVERARRAPRRPRRALVANANTTAAAIGDENASFDAGAGAAARHAAQGQHDVRQPARDARRPRRARGRVQAGDEGPRAVPARAAPAGRTTRARRSRDLNTLVHRRGPNNDLTDLLGKRAGARRSAAKPVVRALDRGAAAGQPVLKFIRPYTPDLVGWLRDFGVGARQLRRQRPLRADPADLQRLPFTDQPDGRSSTPIPPQPAPGRPADAARSSAARAPPAGAGRTARRRSATPTAPWTATRASCPPAHEAPPRHRRRARRGRGAAGLRHRRERRRAAPTACARSSTNAFSVIPGEDVKIAGRQGRQDRVARRHARPQGRRRAAHRPARLRGLPQRRRRARSARSR